VSQSGSGTSVVKARDIDSSIEHALILCRDMKSLGEYVQKEPNKNISPDQAIVGVIESIGQRSL
jgi:hypothetical protein